MNTNRITDQDWKECQEDLKRKLPDPLFRAFIQPLSHQDSEDHILQLRAPDDSLIEHIESRYIKEIESALKNRKIKGQVRIMGPGQLAPSPATGGQGHRTATVQNGKPLLPYICPESRKESIHRLLNGAYPEVVTVIQGPPGSGKSTLCREMASRIGDDKAVHLNLESFIMGFTTALREKKLESWKTTIRSYRYLIIDDFQFIKESAKKTQEEIRHIMDRFLETGHKLILSTDTPVAGLPLQDDLASRIEHSLSVTLDWPDRSSREAILKKLSVAHGLGLDETLVLRLSRMIAGDGRKLEAAIYRIMAAPMVPTTEGELDRICQDLYLPDPGLTPEKLLAIVADYLQISMEGITGPARDRKFSLARQITSYFCTTLLDLKLVEVARVIGRKDHSAVVHGLARFKKMLDSDLFLQTQMDDLKKKILESE